MFGADVRRSFGCECEGLLSDRTFKDKVTMSRIDVVNEKAAEQSLWHTY